MKLEAGKYYKTRDGRKAYVAALREDAIPDECAVGWVLRDSGYWESCWWSANGVFEAISEFNLIAEWTEPEAKVERWLYAKYAVIVIEADGTVKKENLYLTAEAPNELSDMRFYEGRIKLEPME